jgi:hypothetical protein
MRNPISPRENDLNDKISATMKFRSLAAMHKTFHLLLMGALLTGFACGQSTQSQPEKLADMPTLPDAIAKVKSGDFGAIHVELIAEASAVEAIPILKEQFVRVQDPLLKAKIASVLVRLGDKDDTYWDFLLKPATQAVESDAPNFISYDSQGKAIPGASPAFAAWAEAHNSSPDAMPEAQIYSAPGAVGLLALTGDPRAIPVLRRGLLSPNYQIEIMAALGLADLGDKGSIPLITEACGKAPAEAAAAIAQALVYFDDPAAQSAVDQYIPREIVKIYREARAQGRKPFGN